MPVKKGFTSVKKPTVTVETKKIPNEECCSMKKDSDSACCGIKKHHCFGKLILMVFLVLNILLTVCVLAQQKKIEAMRVGGEDNYRMLKQVFQSEGFKNQQKQQIQQAMQMYQVPGTVDAAAKTPTAQAPQAPAAPAAQAPFPTK